MKTKRELIALFNRGDLETIRKECLRYGTITKDVSFDIETGRYAGANRVTHIKHCELEWEIQMLNGNIESMSYTVHH